MPLPEKKNVAYSKEVWDRFFGVNAFYSLTESEDEHLTRIVKNAVRDALKEERQIGLDWQEYKELTRKFNSKLVGRRQ
jgi:hypothetical protein